MAGCASACPRYELARLEESLQLRTRLRRGRSTDYLWLRLYLDESEREIAEPPTATAEQGIDPVRRVRARCRKATRLSGLVRGGGLARCVRALERQLAAEKNSNHGDRGEK
jgi:hypothetical protein